MLTFMSFLSLCSSTSCPPMRWPWRCQRRNHLLPTCLLKHQHRLLPRHTHAHTHAHTHPSYAFLHSLPKSFWTPFTPRHPHPTPPLPRPTHCVCVRPLKTLCSTRRGPLCFYRVSIGVWEETGGKDWVLCEMIQWMNEWMRWLKRKGSYQPISSLAFFMS